METRTVSATKALELQATLNVVKSGKLKSSPHHYKLEVAGDALLVDPVNGDPFVFVAPDTVHVFQHQPGSGTDHLRQRIKASLWFGELAETR